jgi:hypothetical protein
MPPPSTSIDFKCVQEGKSCIMHAISFRANGEPIDTNTKPVIKSMHLRGRGLELQDVKEAQVLQHSAALDGAMSELKKGFKKKLMGEEVGGMMRIRSVGGGREEGRVWRP